MGRSGLNFCGSGNSVGSLHAGPYIRPPVIPCQPILPFGHAEGRRKDRNKRVTNKETDDRISLIEGLAINCRRFGYKTKISLIGSQSLGLEYVVPQNFVGLVIVRICQFLNPGPVRFVFVQEKIL